MNKDWIALLEAFARHDVEHLLVGGWACILRTGPRYTKDLDIWVRPSPANSRRVHAALLDFGAPLPDLGPDSFTGPGDFYTMGRAPQRVDILMGIAGPESFEAAWERREVIAFHGLEVPVIGIGDLIRAKEAAARPMDLEDARKLRLKLQADAARG